MDLIERQAAIDALAKFVPYAICDESTESYTNGLTDAYNLILQLPSAQPYTEAEIQKMQELEQAELQKAYELGRASAQPGIIRCKDCKYAEVADPEDSQDGYTCQFHRGSIWFSGSFCSWAERREE